jgi:hypothetical protein
MPDIIATLLGTTAVTSLFGALVIGFLKLVLKQQALERKEAALRQKREQEAEAFQKA